MIDINKLDHVAVIVESAEEARKFYTENLGFEHMGTGSAEITGDTYCSLRKGESVIELVEVSEKSPLTEAGLNETGLSHIAYQVDDITRAIKELENLPCKIIPEEPVVIGDVKFVYVELPDSDVLEIMEIPEDFDFAYQA